MAAANHTTNGANGNSKTTTPSNEDAKKTTTNDQKAMGRPMATIGETLHYVFACGPLNQFLFSSGLFNMENSKPKWKKPEKKDDTHRFQSSNTEWLGSSGLGGGVSPHRKSKVVAAEALAIATTTTTMLDTAAAAVEALAVSS